MNTIVALFEDLAHVDRAMRALQFAAVPSERIEVVTARRPAEADGVGREGADDLMMGFAAMSLPAFGPVLASGGLMAPVMGSLAQRDGLVDDLIAAGIPRDDAEDYASAVRGGAAIVMVVAAPPDIDRVAVALAECGPIEVEHPRARAAEPT